MPLTSCSIWVDEDYDHLEIDLDCLLPCGFIVEVTVLKNATIRSIKKDLWKVVESLPFGNLLEAPEQHVIECVNEDSETVEITDEDRRLHDIRPFSSMIRVRLKQHQQHNHEQAFNNKLNILIGRNMSDLDSTKNNEVRQFRNKMSRMCYTIQLTNDQQDWLNKVMRLYPPDLNYHDLPPSVDLLKKIKTTINVALHEDEQQTFSSKLEVLPDISPHSLILLFKSKQKGQPLADPNLHILKVAGFQEYLIGDHPLHMFTHVRKALMSQKEPHLCLVHKSSVHIPDAIQPSPSSPTIIDPLPSQITSVFDLDQEFSFKLLSISNAHNVTSTQTVLTRACIYQGGEALCAVVDSKDEVLDEGKADFMQTQSFNIKLQNIPRMARLCMLVYYHVDKKATNKRADVAKKVIRRKDIRPLAWLNIPFFDFKGQLKGGEVCLSMWPVTDELNDEHLNPLGTVETNSELEDAIRVSVSFENFSQHPVYFPSFPDVLAVASEEMRNVPVITVDKEHLGELKKKLHKPAFHVLAEQEKQLIWNLRLECMQHFPESLPILLTCFKWSDYREVSTMQSLLQIWPSIGAKEALELLDFQYADPNVRTFAVKCLEDLSDSDVCLYLLQLVQVLKYESYLDTPLISFLLKRALNNNKMGHSFFWLLRSEMCVSSVSVRFSLFLEAYCRGSAHNISDLCKIVEALNNLRQLNLHIKVCGLAIDKLKIEVRKGLDLKYKEVLSQLCCPINPSVKLKCVRIDKCKCMDSKQKPLWLVWQNAEKFGSDMLLMFKKGDDLRQDMLTLQILKIMDDIWQNNGLDLRMNVYSVLPTNQKEGLIEVVTDSKTQADIQMTYAELAVIASFNRKCIYQWLESVNPEGNDFEEAMEVFMKSCAGYSVATYVLGIGDRHSDNIMIKENGQLFHIDFGHILGNFKSKFGVRRERVPFVLTSDYVYVIKRGDNNKDEFKRFERLCEKAFMVLRAHSKFLITLFMMMMNTGIPEVSCFKNIEYLKETLVPHKTDQEALEHFKGKFTEALKNSWKTSINHMCHNLKVKKAPAH